MNETIANARITSTTLGFEDHGILTIWINVEFDGGGQGFGGFALDDRPLEQDLRKSGYRRQPTSMCGRSISGILQALEVTSWEKLPSTYVRVRKENWNGPISHIGHILRDKWFSFKEAAEADAMLRAREAA